jgi:hypothetical protein
MTSIVGMEEKRKMEKEQIKALREQVMPALICKKEEFQLLGYEQVTIEEIWDCLFYKKWKKLKEEKKLFEIVNDILALSVSEYMTYMTVQSHQETNWFTEDNLEALEELF